MYPISNSSLLTAMKSKVKYRFQAAATFFTFLKGAGGVPQQYLYTFQRYNILEPYIKWY
jgi:hypothetical protein